MGNIVEFLLIVALISVAVFLILLVLVQRGRGGGLVGAFGGAGVQSAFGTKAGDVFTKVTIVTAVIWILLCMVSYSVLNLDKGSELDTLGGAVEQQTPAGTSDSAPGDGTELPTPSDSGAAFGSGEAESSPGAGGTEGETLNNTPGQSSAGNTTPETTTPK